MKAYVLAILYVICILLPLIVVGMVSLPSDHAVLAETGKMFALTGFMIFALQPVLAGRFKKITFPFGLDIVMQHHKRIAVLGGVLVAAHPVLIAAGEQKWSIIFSFQLPWYIWAGKAAMLLVIMNLAVSLLQKRLHLGFERWRLSHAVIGPGLLGLGFVHSIAAGDDLELLPMQALWFAALAVAVCAFAYHKCIRPALLRKKLFHVTGVDQIAPKVWNLTLAPPAGGAYTYLPGQFHFITLHRAAGLPEEEHHFTVSSSPSRPGAVCSTIKESGDFTATIGNTRPGDTAVVHGAFGRFSYMLHGGSEPVFIAGGIGITPIMGMLRHMQDTGAQNKSLLLYANRTEESIAFRDELERMCAESGPGLNLVHVLSRPAEGWIGERGHIDEEMLKRYCASRVAGSHFYICGPEGLRQSTVKALIRLGVADKRIHTEIFSLL